MIEQRSSYGTSTYAYNTRDVTQTEQLSMASVSNGRNEQKNAPLGGTVRLVARMYNDKHAEIV